MGWRDRSDRCDILDVLEESAITGRPVAVQLEGGEEFVDRVKDVVTRDGEDRVFFREHGDLTVQDIREAARAEPAEQGYGDRPLHAHPQE